MIGFLSLLFLVTTVLGQGQLLQNDIFYPTPDCSDETLPYRIRSIRQTTSCVPEDCVKLSEFRSYRTRCTDIPIPNPGNAFIGTASYSSNQACLDKDEQEVTFRDIYQPISCDYSQIHRCGGLTPGQLVVEKWTLTTNETCDGTPDSSSVESSTCADGKSVRTVVGCGDIEAGPSVRTIRVFEGETCNVLGQVAELQETITACRSTVGCIPSAGFSYYAGCSKQKPNVTNYISSMVSVLSYDIGSNCEGEANSAAYASDAMCIPRFDQGDSPKGSFKLSCNGRGQPVDYTKWDSIDCSGASQGESLQPGCNVKGNEFVRCTASLVQVSLLSLFILVIMFAL